jgi:hypothetical protein
MSQECSRGLGPEVVIQILDAITQRAVEVFVKVIVVRGFAIEDTKTLMGVEHNPSSFASDLDGLLCPGTWLELVVYPVDKEV